MGAELQSTADFSLNKSGNLINVRGVMACGVSHGVCGVS